MYGAGLTAGSPEEGGWRKTFPLKGSVAGNQFKGESMHSNFQLTFNVHASQLK